MVKTIEGLQLVEVMYGDITVRYNPSLDGGGTTFGQDFLPVIKDLFGKVGRVCEFACGPAFLGFSLLGNGLCDTLCLTDVNPAAVKSCQRTVIENGLEDKVTVYLSDGLKSIPKSETWDLAVSNPPHFRGEFTRDLINVDPGWDIHREFYRNVSRNLIPGASILFYENLKGSSPKLWQRMIAEAGLEFVKCFRPREVTPANRVLQEAAGIPRDFRTIGYEAFRWRLRQARRDLQFSRILSYLLNVERAVIDPAWRLIDRYPYYFVWSRSRK